MRRRISPRSVYREIVSGLYWGYPLCCIVRFAFCTGTAQATQRGSSITEYPALTSSQPSRTNRYVHCGLFHR